MQNPIPVQKKTVMGGGDVAFLTVVTVYTLWEAFVIAMDIQLLKLPHDPLLDHPAVTWKILFAQMFIYALALTLQITFTFFIISLHRKNPEQTVVTRRRLIRLMALVTGSALLVWGMSQIVLANTTPKFGPDWIDDLSKGTVDIGAILFALIPGAVIFFTALLSWKKLKGTT